MTVRDYSTTANDNTTIEGITLADTMLANALDNAIRQAMADSANLLLDIAKPTATTGSSNAYILTTGGTVDAYTDKIRLAFRASFSNTGACTINVDTIGVVDLKVYNAGGVADPASGAIQSGGVYDVLYVSALGDFVVLNPSSSSIGQQTIGMPAGSMNPTTTNGASAATAELATNDVPKNYLAFDDSTEEYAGFDTPMPKGWDEGTFVAQFYWYSDAATTGDCIWGIQAVAVGDNDAQDAAYGTAQEVTDTTNSTAKDNNTSPETSAITAAGTPASEDLVQFKVYRKAADGSDTLVGDALLTAVRIHYTINAPTDD